MLAISKSKLRLPYLTIGFGLVYLILVIALVPGFMIWDANLCAGILLAPFICKVANNQLSIRYLFPAIITITLALLVPVNTLYFIALVFALLFLIENCLGKVSYASLFLLLLVSPVFRYIMLVADFPIRLWLTEQVAALLKLAGVHAVASGNIIAIDKYEFAVDPACAGLNMLVMSLIICLFLLMHYQKQTARQLSFVMVTALFLATMVLNIVSNYFRILLLVLFKIMPGTFYHDFVGIACLSIYVILPLILGVKPLLIRFGKAKENINIDNTSRCYVVRHPLLHMAMLIALVFVATHIITADSLTGANNDIQMNGFTKKRLESGVLKFENKDALIYLKPTAFYIPGHDPKICWTGSGYAFKNIRKEKFGNYEVYTALLEKDKDKVYAAWWFDNGSCKTIDQIKWRWSALKGGGQYYLVNVNTVNRLALQKQVNALLVKQLF